MSWVDLGNPYPLAEPRLYKPVAWPEGKRTVLPDQSASALKPLAQIAVERRTGHEFGAMSLATFGSLLALTSRIQSCGNERFGFALSKRPAPSAGAIHPIHVIVSLPAIEGWYRYDPMEHVLVELPSPVQTGDVRRTLNEIVPGDDATLLLFAAEPGKTFAKYADACSLIWRDAGVLLGYFAVAAEALSLSFSPLGVTGEPWVSHLVGAGELVGVGAAFVGKAPGGQVFAP